MFIKIVECNEVNELIVADLVENFYGPVYGKMAAKAIGRFP